MAKKRITVSLGEQDFELLKAAVEQGHFSSVSAAAADAIRQMIRERALDLVETEADREFTRTLFSLRGTADPGFDYGI